MLAGNFDQVLALRTRTSASTLGLRSGKDAASLHRLVDHGPANPSPLICVVRAEDDKIDRNADIAEGFTESHELRAAAFQIRLDDQQIQIAVGTTLAPRAGAEKNHGGVGGCRRETATCLDNQGLVSH